MQVAQIHNGQLVIDQETLTEVKNFPKKTKFVVVFGGARLGKSTLCNLLIGAKKFKISKSSATCTPGIWISHPVKINNDKDEYLVVVDSEGTEMGDTTYQYKILSLACMLACEGGVLVHNEVHYANTAFTALSIIANTMSRLKGLESDQFPHLCFLVRNFKPAEVRVKGEVATLDQFFESLLENCKDQYDVARKSIKNTFARRKMFTTRELDKTVSTYFDADNRGKFSAPKSEFKEDYDKFVEWLMGTLEVKKVAGTECDGEMLAFIIERSTALINEVGHISMPDLVGSTIDIICSHLADAVVEMYREEMKKLKEVGNLAESSLRPAHDKLIKMANEIYLNSTERLYKPSVEKFYAVIDDRMASEFVILQNEIRANAEKDKIVTPKSQEFQDWFGTTYKQMACYLLGNILDTMLTKTTNKNATIRATQKYAEEALTKLLRDSDDSDSDSVDKTKVEENKES